MGGPCLVEMKVKMLKRNYRTRPTTQWSVQILQVWSWNTQSLLQAIGRHHRDASLLMSGFIDMAVKNPQVTYDDELEDWFQAIIVVKRPLCLDLLFIIHAIAVDWWWILVMTMRMTTMTGFSRCCHRGVGGSGLVPQSNLDGTADWFACLIWATSAQRMVWHPTQLKSF